MTKRNLWKLEVDIPKHPDQKSPAKQRLESYVSPKPLEKKDIEEKMDVANENRQHILDAVTKEVRLHVLRAKDRAAFIETKYKIEKENEWSHLVSNLCQAEQRRRQKIQQKLDFIRNHMQKVSLAHVHRPVPPRIDRRILPMSFPV